MRPGRDRMFAPGAMIRCVLAAISFAMLAPLIVDVRISSPFHPFIDAHSRAFMRASHEATKTLATAWRFQTCQPGPASSRSAKNAPTALSAWSAAASVPTPATKPCGMPCQTSLLALTPASTARAT